jgi:acyl carrier protein
MKDEEILNELNSVFVDVLDNDSIRLSLGTTANDIEEWDSITHIQLIVAIEKRFKLKFTSAEIRDWKTVGDMMQSIKSKMA